MATIIVSEYNRIISSVQLNQVYDAIVATQYKWFSLASNTLDGSYSLPGLSSELQVGWWGNTLSGIGGELSPPPTLTIMDTRVIHTLLLAGDALLNEYPVDFTIKLYNNSTLLHTETVTNNNSVIWSKNLSQAYNVTKLEISISKISKEGVVAKVVDAFSPYNILRNDDVNVSTTESSSQEVRTTTSDTLQFDVTDSLSVYTGITSTDSLNLSSYNTTGVDVSIELNDSIIISSDESSFFTLYEMRRSDNLSVVSFESNEVQVSIDSIDILHTSSTSSINTEVSLTSTDVITVTDSNDTLIEARINSDDTLSVTEDNNSELHVDTTLTDNISVNVLDTTEISNTLESADVLNVQTSESVDMSIYSTSEDILALNSVIENDLLTASFSVSDEQIIAVSEVTKITNIHTIMNETLRQTYAKVEITYTDPFVDNTINITASDAAYNTDASQLADSKETPEYKWFSLLDNKLDGTFHPISSRYSVGWWSSVLSDTNGDFIVPQVIQVTFAPRAIYFLQVIGDSLLNSYPVDFTIQCYDSNDIVIHTETVTGNTNVKWLKTIDTLLNVTKLVLTITKINNSNNTLKLTEFFTAIVETYYNDRIIDINLLEELEPQSGTISLGSVSSNEIDISLNNADGYFNLGDEASPRYGLIKRNRKVRAWLGAEIIENEIEWHPLGTFWAIGWDIPDGTLEAIVTARDRLEVLRLSDFNISEVYENNTLYELFELVLVDAGLVPTEYIIDSSLQSIVIPYAWFNRMSHRDAIKRLAGCAYISVWCDRDGVINVSKINTAATPTIILDNNTNIYSKSYPISASEITNYVEVATNTLVVQEVQQVLKVTDPLVIDVGATEEYTFTFNSIPVKNVSNLVLTGATGLDIVYNAYAWGIELVLSNNTASPITITEISVDGQPITSNNQSFVYSKDADQIRDNGIIRTSITHDFIQTRSYATQLSNTLLSAYLNSIRNVDVYSRGDIALLIGQVIEVIDDKMNTDYKYITQRQNLKWNGSLSVDISGKKI